MNCLNKETIQAYVDNQIPKEYRAEINSHLQSCNSCNQKVVSYKKDIETIKSLFNSPLKLDIPAFNQTNQKYRSKKIIRIIPYAAAACIAGLLIFHISRNRVLPLSDSELILNEYYNDCDFNQLWHKKSHNIILEDERGNTFYFNSNF